MKPQPEQLLKQLKAWQNKKKTCQEQIDARKTILEDYFNEGLIMSTFSIEGVKAERRRKPEKWAYSNELEQYKKDMTDAIESKEQHEREEGIAKKKETIKEAVEEKKDSDGKVIVFAEDKVEKEYVVMVKKAWNPSTGEQLDDQEYEYSLSQLESEKKRYDDEMAKAKAYSDGLALAIEDYKKL